MMTQEPVQAAIWHCLNHYDYDNAVFLAERLCAELENDETIFVLATCYYRANRVNQAYWLLNEKSDWSPRCRFLLAKCAFQLRNYAEAEAALIINQPPFDETNQYDDIASDFGDTASFVFTLLAQIYLKTERPKTAVVALRNALKMNPFMWHAFADLCHLGESTDPESIFQIPSENIFDACLGQTEGQSPMWPFGCNINIQNEGEIQRNEELEETTDVLFNETAGLFADSQDPVSVPPAEDDILSTPIDQQLDKPNSTAEIQIEGVAQSFMSDLHISSEESQSCTVTPCGNSFGYLSRFSPPTPSLGLLPLKSPNLSAFKSTDGVQGALSVGQILSPQSQIPQTPEPHLALKTNADTPEPHSRNITIDKSTGVPMHRSPLSFTNVSAEGVAEESEDIIITESNIEYCHSSQLLALKKQSAERFMVLLGSLGKAYKELKLFHCQAAIRHFETHIPKQHLHSSWVQSMIAMAHYEQRAYEASAAVFKRLHELDPCRLDSMDMYSSSLWQLQRDKELSALAHDLMSIDKQSPITWCVAGNCFSLQNDHAKAIKYFRRVVQMDRNFTYAFTLLGQELVLTEELDNAMDAFRYVILSDPRDYKGWFGMGTVYAKQEQYDVAELHFIKSLQLNPQNSVILVQIGAMQFLMNKVELSLQTLSTAAMIDPKNPLPRFHRGSIYFSIGKYHEALRELEDLNEKFPKEADILFLLSEIHKKLGNMEMTMMYFSWASELDPKGPKNQIAEPVGLISPQESSSDDDIEVEAGIQHDVIDDVHHVV